MLLAWICIRARVCSPDGQLEEASFQRCCRQQCAAPGACPLSAAALLTGYEEGQACVTFEGCPQSLMDTVVHFLHMERTKLREAAVDRAATAAEAAAAGGGSRDGDEQAPGPAANGLQLDYQRKVTPSERAVLLTDILDDAFEAAAAAAAAAAGEARGQGRAGIACFGQTQSGVVCGARARVGSCLVCSMAGRHSTPCSFAPGPQSAYQSCCVLLSCPALSCPCPAAAGSGGPSAPAGTRRHKLVVVASLVDKVPNLAGLARTAEVLGAGTLVMSDLRVANDSQFMG